LVASAVLGCASASKLEPASGSGNARSTLGRTDIARQAKSDSSEAARVNSDEVGPEASAQTECLCWPRISVEEGAVVLTYDVPRQLLKSLKSVRHAVHELAGAHNRAPAGGERPFGPVASVAVVEDVPTGARVTILADDAIKAFVIYEKLATMIDYRLGEMGVSAVCSKRDAAFLQRGPELSSP
jgi:hypothetical protein